MCPMFVNQKLYTQVQIRLSLPTFRQIFSPTTIKQPGHRLRRKKKGSEIRTGPLRSSRHSKNGIIRTYIHNISSNIVIDQACPTDGQRATNRPAKGFYPARQHSSGASSKILFLIDS